MITGAEVRLPKVPPGSTSLLANWLARNPEFEGIGVSTARKLARTFGGELHAVLSAGDPQPFVPIIGGELQAIWSPSTLRSSRRQRQLHGLVRMVLIPAWLFGWCESGARK